jgi:PAS domain S-box-containing protein
MPKSRSRNFETFAAVLFLIGLLFNAHAFSLDSKTEPGWKVLDVRQQPQGLPQNSVSAILQTHDGYIWVGTRQGLARFDGVRFTTFDARNKTQLPESEILKLVEADDSSLWIATHGGVSRYKDGQFTVFTTQNGLVADYTSSLCKDPEGGIWIGTWSGLSHYKDGRFTNYTAKDGLADSGVPALACDSDGSIWIATRSGSISKFQNGKIISHVAGEPKPSSPIKALCLDRQRALWIGTNDGLFRLKDGKLRHYTSTEGLSSNLVRRLYEDAQGNLWIGTNAGLNRYKDGKISSSGLPGTVLRANITAISEDREGNLWVGTAYEGLVRLHRGQFASYTKEDGLPSDEIQTIFEDHTGTLWIGAYSGLLASRDGTFTRYAEKQGLPSSRVISLSEDHGGHLWVSLEDFGVYRSRLPVDCGNQPCAKPPTFQNVISGVYSRIILQDHTGAIWVGTDEDKGLFRFKDEKAATYTTYTAQDGLPSDITGRLSVRDLAEGPEGELWIGTRAGLGVYRNGKFRAYSEKDGLGNSFIEDLYMDPDGVLWIATYEGLSRLKDGKFTNYTASDGLYCEAIYHIVEDDRHNLWMGCSKGVFRVSKQQLNDFAAGTIHSINPVVYGLEHGLSSSVAAEGNQPGAFKSHDGRIWFAMAKGVSVADPDKLSINTLPPPVHIEEVSIDQHPFTPGQAAEAPPGRGDLEFHYTGLSLLAPEKVRFKYKLEGYDRDWIDAGNRRVAYYGKIPPGQYTFQVIAANNDGVWNRAGASFPFHLKPHFYQTLWFDILCMMAAALSLWWIVGIYQQRLNRREQELAIVEDALKWKTVAEARYRDLFESAVYGIYRARNGCYLEVNRAMVAMLGYGSKEEVLTLNPATQVYADPADFSRVQEALDAAERVEDLEVTWKRKNGTPIIVQLSGRRIPDPQGSANIAEIIAQDVTQQKHLENRLQQVEKMDAIGRLAGGVAHDFNNLLTVILGYTRLLLDRPANPDAAALRQVEKAADRAAGLTNQLLAFSRHKIVQPWVLNLNSIVLNMKTMLERVIGEDVELTTDLASDLGFIRGDRSQIEQVIMNLAVNARDAMPHGGRLHFATRNTVVERDGKNGDVKVRPGKYVMLEASDTGCGMSKETMARIFEPFFTTKEVGRGTGLGLSTIYGIVQQAGGCVDVTSELGAGTIFQVYMPRNFEAEPVTVSEHKPPRKLRGTETVLLVEDHAALREMTSAMLQAQGYTVLQAAHAGEAERICCEHKGRIDVVLTDVVMPEVSGPELAKRLQRLRPGVRLIYTSGYTDNSALREDVLKHNLPFLQKPYDQSELLSKVREVLDMPVPQ